MRHVDSSTDTESSPRRRDRSCQLPELYYEEQWIKKRTRRRGNLRKLARQDSRSFSEEEVRLSKSSSKKDHRRRARSESARYEEEDTDRKLRRKRSKKRSSKSRRDSSESSIESDSYERVESTSRQKFDSRKDERKTDKSNGTESRENLKRDDDEDDDDDESVSEDSLEVVVVRKSLEKKCEKMVSGRRSKTPRESSKETKFTKTRRSTRRKSRSNKLKASDNGSEGVTDRAHSLDREQGAKESAPCAEQTPRTSIDEEKETGEGIVESRYRRDVTDSTSQETVERVVVTAMVHKDQGPDTPKSVVEASKEVTFDDRLRTEVIEVQEVSKGVSSGKMDDILEQSDVSRNDLVQKATSLKKDVEEMRQQAAQEKVQREEESRQSQEGKDSKQDRREEGATQDQDVKLDGDREDTKKVDDTRKDQDQAASDGIEKKDESEKGRLDTRETTESESPTLDSRSERQRRRSRQGDELVSKSDGTSSEGKPDKETHKEKTDVSESTLTKESEKTSKSESPESEKNLEKGDATPRTAVEDVPPSEGEDRKSTSEEIKSKSKTKSGTVRRKPSFDERRSKSSSSKSDESPKKSGGAQKRKEFSKKRESSAKKISMKSSTEKGSKLGTEKTSDVERKAEGIPVDSAQTRETSTTLTKSSSKESPDEKERKADSVRRKSVDFSSSKDSALVEDDIEDKSLSADTPTATKRKMDDEEKTDEDSFPAKSNLDDQKEEDEAKKVKKRPVEDALATEETFRYIDESSSSSPKSAQTRRSRPSTGKIRKTGRPSARKCLFESSEDRSPDRSAIVAVIESPEWDEEDEEIDKEIRDAIGEDAEHETEPEDDNEMGVVRMLPSTSEEETSRAGHDVCRTSAADSLPQVQSTTRTRLTRVQSPQESRTSRLQGKQRRDSGGRDSGIEPSPRVSRIPRRRIMKCCPNTDKQQSLNMDTITRDVQISLRRYHLERKIFFQLMELKRLQIRHGRANEQVLVKRLVDAFHKAGMSGPTLGVARYDQPLTFRHFEAFLYDQLRKLQKRPATPDFCMEAKQCIQKTHRCHHATSAYTSFPVYTYLGGGGQEQADLLPKIESRGKGQMTVEVTHGEEKQIIALPAERLDRSKKYYVTFTVRGEAQQETEKPKSSIGIQRNAKSV
ncbi:hypothetical protein K0M31_013956 [Melipona bicolor]|uniref:Uncharacterized protein n=1 Tax=Melipona bicolor TaxID=60889 RepID=A0AA40KTU4_9HYME|nr:hypothetical protein K0M31_013956 [Melipona bicolor]